MEQEASKITKKKLKELRKEALTDSTVYEDMKLMVEVLNQAYTRKKEIHIFPDPDMKRKDLDLKAFKENRPSTYILINEELEKLQKHLPNIHSAAGLNIDYQGALLSDQLFKISHYKTSFVHSNESWILFKPLECNSYKYKELFKLILEIPGRIIKYYEFYHLDDDCYDLYDGTHVVEMKQVLLTWDFNYNEKLLPLITEMVRYLNEKFDRYMIDEEELMQEFIKEVTEDKKIKQYAESIDFKELAAEIASDDED